MKKEKIYQKNGTWFGTLINGNFSGRCPNCNRQTDIEDFLRFKELKCDFCGYVFLEEVPESCEENSKNKHDLPI